MYILLEQSQTRKYILQCVWASAGDSLLKLTGMFSGHTIGLHGRTESDEQLLEDPVSEVGDEEETSGKVLFAASFEEFSKNHVQYDTVIWVLISVLLVLAWGVGLIMLLYLPIRRYVLQKDISSRRLYVTSNEIVYKVIKFIHDSIFCPFCFSPMTLNSKLCRPLGHLFYPS